MGQPKPVPNRQVPWILQARNPCIVLPLPPPDTLTTITHPTIGNRSCKFFIFPVPSPPVLWNPSPALGVMATVSIVELVVRNAMQSDAFLVAAACCGGALAYYVAEPFFPKMDEPGAAMEHHHHHYGKVSTGGGMAPLGVRGPGVRGRGHAAAWCHTGLPV